MNLKLLNVVFLANDYQTMVQWYQEALGLEIVLQESGDYHYTELAFDKQVIVGIADAKEMNHTPTTKRNNSALMQLGVSDIKAVFKQIEKCGGTILFGPDYEENNKFYYGAATDIEGNEIWFIQE